MPKSFIPLACVGLLFLTCAPASPAAPILGRDQNGNGMWDDSEIYLQAGYRPDTEDFRALWQLAGAMQRFIQFGSDPRYTSRVADELRRGLECAFYVGRMAAQQHVQTLKDRIVSTAGRRAAFQEAEAAAVGHPFRMTPDPHLWHQSCAFAVQIFPNWPKN